MNADAKRGLRYLAGILATLGLCAYVILAVGGYYGGVALGFALGGSTVAFALWRVGRQQ